MKYKVFANHAHIFPEVLRESGTVGVMAQPAPERGESGATTRRSATGRSVSMRKLMPLAKTPSSLEIRRKGLFVLISVKQAMGKWDSK